MRLRNLLLTSLVVLSALAVTIKLFTVELTYPDDPSIALAVRGEPALNNRLTLDGKQRFSDFHTLLIDENAYLGQTLYRGITAWGWWLLPLITTGLLLKRRTER